MNSTFRPFEQLGLEVLKVWILYQQSEKIPLDQSAWKLKCSLFIIILFFFTMYSLHENLLSQLAEIFLYFVLFSDKQ